MRYAMIMAGGSGTRLWPMSRDAMPKQLIPFIRGKSLLRIAWDRLDGLVAPPQRYICAGFKHRDAVLHALGGALSDDRYLGEPMGRDTLNAVGLSAAVIGRRDADAVIAVFTADHIIEPVDAFQQVVTQGCELAEQTPDTLVTFGIRPTDAATGYGYLELGESIESGASVLRQFKEKPPQMQADEYFDAGPDRFLWNSGMFVWRAATLMDCIRRYEPDVFAGLSRIAEAWDTPTRDDVLNEVYPNLKKISIDFAVMEPASRDDTVRVAAVPMPVTWLDVGSWPSFADTCDKDEQGNALAAPQHLLLDSRNTLVASDDPDHLIATIGCESLVIVHTRDATLVCPKDDAQRIKELHAMVKQKLGVGRV